MQMHLLSASVMTLEMQICKQYTASASFWGIHPNNLHIKHRNKGRDCDLIWGDGWCAWRRENGCEKDIPLSVAACVSKDGVCMRADGHIHARVLPVWSHTFHRSAQTEIKKQDQQSWSPFDCFIFCFILHPRPHHSLLPADHGALLWSKDCGHGDFVLWSHVLFVSMCTVNRDFRARLPLQ